MEPDNVVKIKRPKKHNFLVTLVAVAVLVTIFFNLATISVPEDSFVLIQRFNKVMSVHENSGLIVKVPIIDNPIFLKKTNMVYDLNPSDVLTVDKKAMTVSSYVIWKISNPLLFLQTAYNRTEAERRLDSNAYNAIKNYISTLQQVDVISMRGKDLEKQIIATVATQMETYGITIVDIQIKQFDLPPDNKEAAFNRMISERFQIAAQYRAEGKEEADKIRNTINKEKMEIESLARSDAQKIVAEGERAYMKKLYEAYNTPEKQEFYEFMRSLDALKITMTGEKTIILPMDSPLTKWFVQK